MRQAAATRLTPIAFDANGTVRDARGFTSSTNTSSSATASCTFSTPTTPSAGPSRRTISCDLGGGGGASDCAGSTQAESPECTPASSTCCMTARDIGVLAVAQRVDVDLDRALEEPVDERRTLHTREGALARRSANGTRASRGRRARTTGGPAPDSRSAPRASTACGAGRRDPPLRAANLELAPAARRSARDPRRGRRRRTASRGS